ncbi:MAG: hypothetical protein WA869_02885, partial [Alloacidobacterium sp.]
DQQQEPGYRAGETNKLRLTVEDTSEKGDRAKQDRYTFALDQEFAALWKDGMADILESMTKQSRNTHRLI